MLLTNTGNRVSHDHIVSNNSDRAPYTTKLSEIYHTKDRNILYWELIQWTA